MTETGTAHCWPLCLCVSMFGYMVGFEQRYEEKKYSFCCNPVLFSEHHYKMTSVLIKMHEDTHVLFLEKLLGKKGFYSCD